MYKFKIYCVICNQLGPVRGVNCYYFEFKQRAFKSQIYCRKNIDYHPYTTYIYRYLLYQRRLKLMVH